MDEAATGGIAWAGRRALDALAAAGTHRVLAVHGRGFWVETPAGVVGLLRLPAPRSPRLVGLEPALPLPPACLARPPELEVNGSRLAWTGPGGSRIVADLAAAPVWDPPPVVAPAEPPAGLAERAAQASRLLRLLSSRELDVPAAAVQALAAAARSADEAALALAVAGLAGRGAGLTPSGDDVLAGFALLSPPDLRRRLRHLARTAATTRLSRDLLLDACGGHSFEPAVDLARWLLGRESGQPAQLLSRLLRVGHLSGLGLATGMLAAAGAPAGGHDGGRGAGTGLAGPTLDS